MATNRNTLTAAEVAAIIVACGDAQVRVLKYAGLYVEFSRKESSPSPEPGAAVLVPHVPAAEIAAKQAESQKKALAQVDLDAREDEIAELKLTDPEEYEKLVINGDLDEESTDGREEDA